MPSRSSERGARPARARLKPPRVLEEFQRWFGAATSRPLRPLRAGNTPSPRGVHGGDGTSLAREANTRLATANGLSGLARLEVYNRQYWFRLITIMQEEYPCTLHVVGLEAFNTWVVRYLSAHPPASPYLADLDAGFPAFLRRRYRAPRGGASREKVVQAVAYDKACSRAFDAPAVPVEQQDGTPSGAPRDPARARWVRAPHVTPVWMHWDFAAYRTLCRADDALTGRFPLKRKGGAGGHGVCLHRHDDVVYEKPITRAEYLLLEALGAPRTLDQVFRAATKGAPPRDRAAMERHVAAWFKSWTELHWISAIAG